MKRSDIQIGSEYAAHMKLSRYEDKARTYHATILSAIEGRPGYYNAEVEGSPLVHTVNQRNLLATWAAHEKAQAAKEAKRQKERDRQNAAWEAKRREERERYEQNILPAFTGLPTVGHVSQAAMPEGSGDPDLADYIRDTMLRMGSSTVTLREVDLRGIADRILELQAIAQQSALVASDPPEAGHSPLTNMQRIERELAERLEREDEFGR